MDFSLTPEQQQIGETARRFGAELFVTGRDGDLWIDAMQGTVQGSVPARPLPPR